MIYDYVQPKKKVGRTAWEHFDPVDETRCRAAVKKISDRSSAIYGFNQCRRLGHYRHANGRLYCRQHIEDRGEPHPTPHPSAEIVPA